MTNITDFVKWVKELEKKVKLLEASIAITNLTIPNTGKLVVPKYTADPAGGDSTQGQIYYNTVSGKFRGYDGASWVDLS